MSRTPFLTLAPLCRQSAGQDSTPKVTLSDSTPGCRVDGLPVRLGPREHSLLLFLCKRVLSAEPPLADYQAAVDLWSACRADLHARRLPSGADWRSSCSIPVDVDSLRHDVSSIRKKLSKAGPAGVALAKSLPARGRFSLDLPASRIDLLEATGITSPKIRPPQTSA